MNIIIIEDFYKEWTSRHALMKRCLVYTARNIYNRRMRLMDRIEEEIKQKQLGIYIGAIV